MLNWHRSAPAATCWQYHLLLLQPARKSVLTEPLSLSNVNLLQMLPDYSQPGWHMMVMTFVIIVIVITDDD